MVSPAKSPSLAIAINSLTLSNSSERKAFFTSSSFSEINRAKFHLEGIIPGINLAILSASNNGKSNTRAVSRIADFVAILP